VTRRRALFSKADIRRACEAAPGRTVEIIAPDGTKIRLVPGDTEETDKLKVAPRKEFHL
jgi:hypothetical protein